MGTSLAPINSGGDQNNDYISLPVRHRELPPPTEDDIKKDHEKLKKTVEYTNNLYGYYEDQFRNNRKFPHQTMADPKSPSMLSPKSNFFSISRFKYGTPSSNHGHSYSYIPNEKILKIL